MYKVSIPLSAELAQLLSTLVKYKNQDFGRKPNPFLCCLLQHLVTQEWVEVSYALEGGAAIFYCKII